MKKDNIKVTPEVLLLTAILGVPTGEVKKDGSRERFYPSMDAFTNAFAQLIDS